eukprot:15741301-Heterocapsa_arctica.AAC.1
MPFMPSRSRRDICSLCFYACAHGCKHGYRTLQQRPAGGGKEKLPSHTKIAYASRCKEVRQ